MKIRISRDLYARVVECAAAVNCSVSEWSRRAMMHAAWANVAKAKKRRSATREDTVVATLFGDQGQAGDMLAALEYAVDRCEKARRSRFVTDKREGVDYVVEKEA